MKPDRNDPCPCGSGNKYKKCCGLAASSGASPQAGGDPFQVALKAFESGQYAQAQAACARALKDFPEHGETNHLCGLVSHRLGHLPEAQTRIMKAISAAPGNAALYNSLSLIQRERGDIPAATTSARRAIELDARFVDAHNTLAIALKEQGDLAGAAATFRDAVSLDPANALYQSNLANVLYAQDEFDEAEQAFHGALKLNPRLAPALAGLGGLRVQQKRWAEAREVLEQAIASGFSEPTAFNNLGVALHKLKDPKTAIRRYRQALASKPDFGGAYYNLGLALMDIERFTVAAAAFEQALAQNYMPGDTLMAFVDAVSSANAVDRVYSLTLQLLHDDALLTMAVLLVIIDVLGKTCNFKECSLAWRKFEDMLDKQEYDEKTLELALSRCYYTNKLNETTVQSLHRQWGELAEARLASVRYREYRRPEPGQRLRIGYLSPDLRTHSVAFFVQHVIAQHDRSAVEVFCYALSDRSDAVTDFIRSHSDQFHNVTDLEEVALAKRIHDDGIQILIDLTGHAGTNRISMFARKPAPVQMTWIGYLNNTGLPSMDYRITDPHVDDPAANVGPEKLLVLPESFLCFGSFPECHIDPVLPATRNGCVTFASFNNLMKLTDETVRVWAQILALLPGARIIIMTATAGSEAVKQNLLGEFAQHGIAPERIDLRPTVPRQEYLAAHNEVDIILDTWPFNGGTITAGALWMGVPVVTLVGTAHRQRVTYSMLKNIGVEETIAWSEKAYIEAAVSLAQNPAALAELRQRIAHNTRASILCDAPRFTRQFEAALLQAWREYCAGTSQ